MGGSAGSVAREGRELQRGDPADCALRGNVRPLVKVVGQGAGEGRACYFFVLPPIGNFGHRCGYTAARTKDLALRPNRGRRRDMENGAIAQLGERFNGIEEVVGSIPSGSTTITS